jgi:hypothetical protein
MTHLPFRRATGFVQADQRRCSMVAMPCPKPSDSRLDWKGIAKWFCCCPVERGGQSKKLRTRQPWRTNLVSGACRLCNAQNPKSHIRRQSDLADGYLARDGTLLWADVHSKRCVDVTSYYSNGKGDVCSIRGGAKLPPGVEYRALLPTACDLQRCRLANGKPLQK